MVLLSERRLITLVGPPGAGKSALALQVAAKARDAFLGGIVVAECSGLSHGSDLNCRLLELLNGSPEVQDVAKVMGHQQLLVVLDLQPNFVRPAHLC